MTRKSNNRKRDRILLLAKEMLISMKVIGTLLIVLTAIPSIVLISEAHSEGICATVKIEIPQELTLERQAFDARMRINNSLTSQTVDNVSVTVTFADENGNVALATSDPNNTSASFFIRIDTMDGIGDVTGEGTILPDSSGEIHWLIIPSPGAAGNTLSGRSYTVGADLSYSIGGKPYHHEVAPDFITVKPQPELELDYFLAEHVRGDEPFTPQVEPVEPFSLGVRVKNAGYGPANNLTIESAQPRIVENERGLLIGFEITGSYVDDEPAEPTLLIDFGDIQPKSARIGRWVMESSLSGSFKSFQARFHHADELGGRLTSLLKRTSAHILIKDVLVDLPGRDRVHDFLAADGGLVRTYESSGVDTAVTNYEDTYLLTPRGTTEYGRVYEINVPPTAGMFLVRTPNPLGDGYVVTKAIRQDGKVLPEANAWTDKRGTGSDTKHFVGLFDSNGGGRYVIELSSLSHLPQPPTLQFIPDYVRSEGQRLSFVVQGSDPNGTIPSLSLDLAPIGAKFEDEKDGFGYFDWQIALGQGGSYPLTFRASDGELEYSRTATVTVHSLQDSDGDGLDDEWERRYFGDLSKDGSSDSDQDGLTDREEYELGGDPTFAGNAPSIPLILTPFNGSETEETLPTFTVENSLHGKLLPTYEFEVFRDEQLTQLITTGSSEEQPEQTNWQPLEPLSDNSYYYWRVRAKSDRAYSEWAYGEFFINTKNDAPTPPDLIEPAPFRYVGNTPPLLQVANSSDRDRDEIHYTFHISTEEGPAGEFHTSPAIAERSLGRTPYQIPDGILSPDTGYYWRVTATDEHGSTTTTDWQVFALSATNLPPSAPLLVSPVGGTEFTEKSVSLEILASEDPEGDPLTYTFQYSGLPTFFAPTTTTSEPVEANGDTVQFIATELVDNFTYYWRAKASDATGDSPWSYGEFRINLENDAPPLPVVRNPGKEAWVSSDSPLIDLAPIREKDGDDVRYRFELFSEEAVIDPFAFSLHGESSWRTGKLKNFTRYWWRVQSRDEHGLESQAWTEVHSFVTNSLKKDIAPTFRFVKPCGETTTIGTPVAVTWEDSDPDSQAQIKIGVNGVILVRELEEDSPENTWTFETTGLTPGTYSFHARIQDEVNSVAVTDECLLTLLSPPDQDGNDGDGSGGQTTTDNGESNGGGTTGGGGTEEEITDSDGDGVADTDDNCPYTSNPDQSDRGGFLTKKPDGIGDACQCGDVSGNGIVNAKDARLITRFAKKKRNTPGKNLIQLELCNVTKKTACNKADAKKIRRLINKQKRQKRKKKKRRKTFTVPSLCEAAVQ